MLAIDPRDVSAVSDPDVRASVSADGQSIDVTVPAGATAPFQFTYLVGNGKVKAKARAAVKVTIVHGQAPTTPPSCVRDRPSWPRRHTPSWPASGSRSRSSPTGATPSPTRSSPRSRATRLSIDGQGRLAYLAPPTPGKGQIDYVVDDGRGGRTKGAVPVEVIALTETRARPPVTQPDVIRGVVGKSLQIEPLGNDIAGRRPERPRRPDAPRR